MTAAIGFIFALVLVFAPIFAATEWCKRYKPNATAGEVGPWIILFYVLMILVLLASLGSQ